MEIEVGDYIRTKFGDIGIVTKKHKESYLDCDWYNVLFQGYERSRMIGISKKDTDIKHSEDILKILEEDDIVNGFTIEKFYDEEENEYLGIPIYSDSLMNCIEEVRPVDNLNIKTILTHEKYRDNCFYNVN